MRPFLLMALTLAALTTFAEEPGSVARLRITGAVKQELTLSPTDLAAMPRAEVKVSHNGMETVYSGVWLNEVLKRAGVPQGDAMRGKALAGYVVAEAQDGYRVVFSLGELDPAIADQPVMLADTANGKQLFGGEGQFRLVLPKDKVGARSVRMLTKIEVFQVH
jgi:DMSO/TMAO reductase YedYZ molybdopterin-dependent catalytic subunit